MFDFVDYYFKILQKWIMGILWPTPAEISKWTKTKTNTDTVKLNWTETNLTKVKVEKESESESGKANKSVKNFVFWKSWVSRFKLLNNQLKCLPENQLGGVKAQLGFRPVWALWHRLEARTSSCDPFWPGARSWARVRSNPARTRLRSTSLPTPPRWTPPWQTRPKPWHSFKRFRR